MVVYYDEDHLSNRQETFLYNESGEIRFRGIYDFSYKYRTRVFDPRGMELGYAELDITSPEPRVDLRNADGEPIAFLVRKGGLFLEPDHLPVEGERSRFLIRDLVKAENGKMILPEEDVLKYVLLLFAMIEIERKK